MAEIIPFPKKPWPNMAMWTLDMFELAVARKEVEAAQQKLYLLRLEQACVEIRRWFDARE